LLARRMKGSNITALSSTKRAGLCSAL